MTLPPDQLDAIIARAAAYELKLVGASRRGVTLELEPASLDDLPSASALRALAEELGGEGIRYVTLSLEVADDEP